MNLEVTFKIALFVTFIIFLIIKVVKIKDNMKCVDLGMSTAQFLMPVVDKPPKYDNEKKYGYPLNNIIM